MLIKHHSHFRKHFKKRISPYPDLRNQFEERFILFLQDRSHPKLKDHKLSGKYKGYRAISISGDLRLIYRIEDEVLLIYDIGTHNQVYK